MSLQWMQMGSGVIGLTLLTLAGGLLLSWTAKRFRVAGDPLVNSIDQLLPQTQCGQCGHPGCRPYAEAIAQGEPINRCPPGGQETVDRLAELLGQEAIPLDADPDTVATDTVAFIIESECIGCTKCIQACPVDAIIGAPKLMHTVVFDLCTGCDLCIAPCPVDCIEMIPRPKPASTVLPTAPQLLATDRQGMIGGLHG